MPKNNFVGKWEMGRFAASRRFKTSISAGFSLVEMLVVVVIIGILAALGGAIYSKTTSKSKEVACISAMRQIAMAINGYANDNDGRLPGPCSVGVYNYARSTPLDTDLAHLGSYIGYYLGAKPYDPANPSVAKGAYTVDGLKCPTLSESSQNDPTVPNFCMMDLISFPASKRTYMFGSISGGSTMAAAKASSVQPKRLQSLTPTEYRTAFLCAADQVAYATGSGAIKAKLPATGPFDGKRPWLFLDGTVSLSEEANVWTKYDN